MIILKYKKLSETAKVPAKAHAKDAAYDVYADLPTAPMTLKPFQTAVVPSGMSIVPPEGWSCDLRGRSGMNSKGKLVALGLIDAEYTGPWGIVLYNGTNSDIIVSHHDRIAQFTVNKVYESSLEEAEDFNLSDNSRANNGFGSTGN